MASADVAERMKVCSKYGERSERKGMEAWVLKSAPGIPGELAACFAWYVTLGQDIDADIEH